MTDEVARVTTSALTSDLIAFGFTFLVINYELALASSNISLIN